MVQTNAAIKDNIGTSVIEQTIGSWEDDSDAHSLIGLLKLIADKIADQMDKLITMDAKMDTLETELSNVKTVLDKVSVLVSNQSAAQGGGCYYTVYTEKAYLDGYKLRLSDGTSAKSCIIQYDEDRDYYAGVLKAPLADDITIELINKETGVSQGSVSTSAATASGYATINLDPLLLNNLSTLLSVDDTVAYSLITDPTLVKNDTYFPVILNHVYEVNHDVDEFLNTLTGDKYASTTFDELLENEIEFVNAVAGDTAYRSVLTSQEFTERVVDDRGLLRQIGDSSESRDSATHNSIFTSCIRSSSLCTTQLKNGGQENTVEGNLILVSMNSGATFSSKVTSTQSNIDYATSQCPGCHAYTRNVYKNITTTAYRPNCYVNDNLVISASNSSKECVENLCSGCGTLKFSNVSYPDMSVSYTNVGFVSKIGTETIAGSAYRATIIVYIDLNAED